MANNPGKGRGKAAKTAAAKSKPPREPSRLDQVLDAVCGTARAKGWIASVEHRDDKTDRYASVRVSKFDGRGENVEGTVAISLEGNAVRFPLHPKSNFLTTGLADLGKSIGAAIEALPWIQKKNAPAPPPVPLDELVHILRRFHAVARQIRKRHNGRPSLDVADEYDVQDLLHALLRSRFDDVRPEEAAPSVAGANSRIDFLLKAEKVAVETKMTRANLRDKQVGEELLVDIARYRAHPDCRSLVCLVYDPNGYIANPEGIEKDLSGTRDGLNVRVVVCPKH